MTPKDASTNVYSCDSSSSSTSRQETANADEATETSPLLFPSSGNNIPTDNDGQPTGRTLLSSPKAIAYTMLLAILLVSLGDKLYESPQQRIIESVICYEHYERVDPSKLLASRDTVGPGAIGGVAEMFCKVDEVQNKLAEINGYLQTFLGFPSLLLAVPFGWIADRYGRWPVLFIGMIGFPLQTGWVQICTWYWQTFNIKMVWFASLAALCGGGSAVVSGLLLVVVADVVPSHLRAAIFLQVSAVNLSAGLVMPPLAAWLMTINPWIPSLVATLLMVLAVLVLLPVPETLNFHKNNFPNKTTTSPNPSQTIPAPPEPPGVKAPVSWSFSDPWLSKLRSAALTVFHDWRVPATVLTFFVHTLAMGATPLLMQYASKRYGMTFSKATLLLTIRSAVNMVLLLLILPYLSYVVMHHWNLSSRRKDLYLARASAFFSAIGFCLIGLAPNIPSAAVALAVCSLGTGVFMMIRAFITSLVPGHQIARAYSAISIIDTLGAMVGSPLLAGLFEGGLSIGGYAVGMPFYFLGLCFAGVFALFCLVGVRKGEEEQDHKSTDSP